MAGRPLIAAALATALLCALPAAAQAAKPRLVIEEQRTDTGAVPIEGYYGYLEVRRRKDDSVVFQKEYPGGPISLDRRFKRGRYTLVSYDRYCNANCGNLGAPANRCERKVRLRRNAARRFTLHTAHGQPCHFARA